MSLWVASNQRGVIPARVSDQSPTPHQIFKNSEYYQQGCRYDVGEGMTNEDMLEGHPEESSTAIWSVVTVRTAAVQERMGNTRVDEETRPGDDKHRQDQQASRPAAPTTNQSPPARGPTPRTTTYIGINVTNTTVNRNSACNTLTMGTSGDAKPRCVRHLRRPHHWRHQWHQHPRRRLQRPHNHHHQPTKV